MFQFFQFEADFVESLRCIPMQVRFKLDTCGIKLKLVHWYSFSSSERQFLVSCPCQTLEDRQTYREHLRSLVFQKFQTYPSDLPIDPHPPWLRDDVPIAVQQQLQQLDQPAIEPIAWQQLTPLQRFVLIKLSQSNHENSNFMPALQEFGLTS
ncbi:MAG: nitrate reductase associated protein [Pseudanabaenaceae cyanobacterium bins.39]|nr:nitrate reductase associated protein [Pseudanabaenaceae cyanobacterium bins.39]